MTKVWKVVAIVCLILFVFCAALIAVAYATGGSYQRLVVTTDIADMTKFMSREQIYHYLSLVLPHE